MVLIYFPMLQNCVSKYGVRNSYTVSIHVAYKNTEPVEQMPCFSLNFAQLIAGGRYAGCKQPSNVTWSKIPPIIVCPGLY